MAAATPSDSLRLARLDSALVGYTSAIERQSVEVKMEESDFLISSSTDSTTVQHIALWLFDHYVESKLMGDEAVAIHIYDNWFANGKVKMRGEFEQMDAEIFARFNRNTLLGMQAPKIALSTRCGRKVELPDPDRVSIIFFYDTECGKCKLESKLLPGVLNTVTFPAVFYAVYCGQSQKAWRQFRRSFKPKNRNLEVKHLWDPEVESGYLLLYGVTSTPKLYVADRDGEIIGRRLEVESLQEIIGILGQVWQISQ